MKTKNGSSLIVVLLVIAGVITVTIGAQRVVLVQFAQSSQASDNTFAYNAAKAGVEDGLARFRYDRNVETATDSTGNQLAYRYDLTAGSPADSGNNPNNGEINPKTTPLTGSASDEVYDLSINYKANQIGMNTDGTPNFTSTNETAKDGFLELTGFSQDPGSYYLRYAFNFAGCTDSRAFAQLQVTYYDTAAGSSSVSEVLAQPTAYAYDSSTNIANLLVNPVSSQIIKTIRIRPYYCDMQYAFNTSRSQNGIGVGSDAGPKFDSLTTNILSTGYYGAAQRTLLATVNRQTGQLISIYDFTAYAGNGSVSP